MENNDFEIKSNENNITDSDFTFVQQDKRIYDVKFKSKRTTYFKDIVRRFVKNKASVVGFVIISIILLCSVILPFTLPGQLDVQSPSEKYLPPKLFPAGTGFWDGTQTYKGFTYDYENKEVVFAEGSTIGKEGVIGEPTVYESTTNSASKYAKGGSLHISSQSHIDTSELKFDVKNANYSINVELLNASGYKVSVSYNAYNSSNQLLNTKGEVASSSDDTALELVLGEYTSSNSATFDVNNLLKTKWQELNAQDSSNVLLNNASYIKGNVVILANSDCIFTKINFTSSNSSEQTELNALALNNSGNEFILTANNSKDSTSNHWNLFNVTAEAIYPYQATIYLCDFKFDPYEYAYGARKVTLIDGTALPQLTVGTLKAKGYIDFTIYDGDGNVLEINQDDYSINADRNLDGSKFTIKITELDSNNNYILVNDESKPVTIVASYSRILKCWTWNLECHVLNYRKLGYSSMPIHIFGTDANGYDMLKLVSKGTLYSLGIGIVIAVICMTIGLIWGSISGYYGKAVDLIMERIVDILSYIPTMVVLTLFLLNWGRNIGTFVMALCLTGWIGTAAVTRTQFYRYKGHEYVLASRSLGASSPRLIFKHILPNGLGTIITSSVLIVPSVIYSEASLSFLGLGFTDIMSLGRIIQENQNAISTVLNSNPQVYLIVFPSVVLALLLIAFEMFGQGLRDSVNPNLKGSN